MRRTTRAILSPRCAAVSIDERGTLTMANSAATNSAFSSTSTRMIRTAPSLSIPLLPALFPLAVALVPARGGDHPGHGVVEDALHLHPHAVDLHGLADG